MIDVASGVVLCYGWLALIGLGFSYLLLRPQRRLEATLCFAPVVGLALTTLGTFVLVRLELPVKQWAWWWLAGSGTASLILFAFLRRRNPDDQVRRRFVLQMSSAVMVTMGLALLPHLLGGIPFAALRGNMWDFGYYVGMANYFEEEAYSSHNLKTRDELTDVHPVYSYFVVPNVDQQLEVHPRWLAMATLAWTAQVTGTENYRFEYGFEALLLILTVGPIFWLARRAQCGSAVGWLLAVGIAVGFWAQVIQDLHALSHLTSIPLLVLIVACLVHAESLQSENSAGNVILLTLSVVALTLQYVEMVPILVLATGALYIISVIHHRSFRLKYLVVAGLPVAVGVGFIWSIFPTLFDFLQFQANVATNLNPTWWQVHFPFLYADPLRSFPGLVPLQADDVLKGLPACRKVAMAVTGLSVMFWAASAAGLALSPWSPGESGVSRTTSAFTFACLIACAGLTWMGQKWSAAKAVTYAYPFVLCGFAFFVGWAAMTLRQRGWSRSAFVIKLLPCCFFVSQLGLAALRCAHAVNGNEYAHYLLHSHVYRSVDLDPRAFLIGPGRIPQQATCAVATNHPFAAEHYINALREHTHVVNRSIRTPVSRSGPICDPRHHSLPDYVLVTRQFVTISALPGLQAVAENRDFCLIRLKGWSGPEPFVLWTSWPAQAVGPSGEGDCFQAVLCVAAATDSTQSLPSVLFLPREVQSAPAEAFVVQVYSGGKGEREFSLDAARKSVEVPLRKGLNNIRIRVVPVRPGEGNPLLTPLGPPPR